MKKNRLFPKFLAFALCALMVTMAMTVTASAAATKNERFDIPYAVNAPTIDGVIEDGEWENALERVLTPNNVDEPTNTGFKTEGGTFLWMWDDTGVYLAATIKDTTPMSSYHRAGQGSYNAKDGVQVCIYPNGELSGSTVKTLLFYSFCPYADNGSAVMGEHFCYGTGSAGADIPANEGKIAAKYSKTSYVIEVFLSKESLTKTTPAMKFAAGTTFALANIILDDQDGSKTAIFTDTAWFSGVESNKYTLNADLTAGYVEEIVEETEAPAAAAAASSAPKAAKTADMGIVLALTALLGSSVTFVSSKRRK